MSGFTRASFPSGKSRNSTAAASPWIPPTPVRRARRRPPSGTGFHTRYVTFPRAPRALARLLFRARAGWGVRLCTDSGLSPPTLEGHFRMTNRRGTWGTGFPDIRGQGRAIRQQEHSAPPRLPTDVQQDRGEREQRALQSALPAPQGGVPTMALTQHRHQPWRHPGSDDHRSATPPPCFPRPCRAAPPIRKRLALELPLLRSPSCSAKAPPSPLNWMNHLPAGTAWQYESTCDSLATPLSCRRDERRVGRRQLEADTDWSVESNESCAKPFAGTGERGPRTAYKQGQGRVAFVCKLPTQVTRVKSRQTTPRRVVDPLSAATALCRSHRDSNFICGTLPTGTGWRSSHSRIRGSVCSDVWIKTAKL